MTSRATARRAATAGQLSGAIFFGVCNSRISPNPPSVPIYAPRPIPAPAQARAWADCLHRFTAASIEGTLLACDSKQAMQFLEIKTAPGLPPNLRRLVCYLAVFAGDQVCSRPRSFSEVRILWGLLARGPVFTCIIRRRRPSQRRDRPFALCAQVIAQDALGLVWPA